VGAATSSTIVQRAWPTNATGGYQPPPQPPLTFAPFVEPIRAQPLPWRFNGKRGLFEFLAFLIFCGSLINRIQQGQWRRVLRYLLLFCVVTIGIGALILGYLARPLEAGETYSWAGWYWILYIGGAVLGALTVIARILELVMRLARWLIFGRVGKESAG
jgi:hypothetical protein